MRSYGMYDITRGLTLALVAGLAGFGLWAAARIGTGTTGRFWIAMSIIAAAGFLVVLARHVGTWTKGLRLRISPTTFIVAFLPVLVCVGWVLLASQPGNGWGEGRVASWSASIGILGVVRALGVWAGVLAFGLGVMLALSFDGVPAPVPVDPVATDEPVGAERTWRDKRQTARVSEQPAPRSEEPAAR